MQLLQRRFALGAAAVIVAMASAASAGPTSAQSKQDWAFATDVMSRSNGAFYGVAVSPAGRVRIDFFADQRLLADELVSRYGSRVDVRLGAFAYPDMNRRSSVDPGPDRPCPTIPTPGPSNASLKWSAAPRVLRIHSGGDMTVKVSFTNVRAKVVRYDSGEPIIGVISEAGTKRVVATYAWPDRGCRTDWHAAKRQGSAVG